MKAIILQHDVGEYDDYMVINDNVLISENDKLSLEELYKIYTEYISRKYEEFKIEFLKTHKKFSRTSWDKFYRNNKYLHFSQWLIENYDIKEIKFEEILL